MARKSKNSLSDAESILVDLNSVSFAPREYFDLINAIFISTERMVKDFSIFTDEYLQRYIEKNPPIVVSEDNRYACVGNHASLFLSMSIGTARKIHVNVYESKDTGGIVETMFMKTILPAFIFSYSGKSRFVMFLSKLISMSVFCKYLTGQNLSQLFRKVDVSRQHFYRIKKVLKKHLGVSDGGLEFTGGKDE